MFNRFTISKLLALLSMQTEVALIMSYWEDSDYKVQDYVAFIILYIIAFTYSMRMMDSAVRELSNKVNRYYGREEIVKEDDIFDVMFNYVSRTILENLGPFSGMRHYGDLFSWIQNDILDGPVQAAVWEGLRNVMVRRALPAGNGDEPAGAVALPIHNNRAQFSLNEYTPALQRFIDSVRKRPKNSDEIAELKITDEHLKNYICPISHFVADIPVLLGGTLYDLEWLLKLPMDHSGARRDPLTQDRFYLRDLQPARSQQQELEKIIYDKTVADADKKANYALTQLKAKNYPEAIKYFGHAINAYEKVQLKNERLTTFHYNLATSYYHLNQPAFAEMYARVCYHLRKDLFGEDNDSTKRAKFRLEEFERAINIESRGLSLTKP